MPNAPPALLGGRTILLFVVAVVALYLAGFVAGAVAGAVSVVAYVPAYKYDVVGFGKLYVPLLAVVVVCGVNVGFP
jgi:hypothetical protein